MPLLNIKWIKGAPHCQPECWGHVRVISLSIYIPHSLADTEASYYWHDDMMIDMMPTSIMIVHAAPFISSLLLCADACDVMCIPLLYRISPRRVLTATCFWAPTLIKICLNALCIWIGLNYLWFRTLTKSRLVTCLPICYRFCCYSSNNIVIKFYWREKAPPFFK